MTLRTRQVKVSRVNALQPHHKNGMRSGTAKLRRMIEGDSHVGSQANATHARHLATCVVRLYKDIARWETKRNQVNTRKRAKLRELIFKFNLYADMTSRAKGDGFEDVLEVQEVINAMYSQSFIDQPIRQRAKEKVSR